MPNTNNPLTEILTYFIATILIIGGFVLLYVGKINVSDTIIFVGAGAGAVGLKFAFQTPNTAQQNQLATIATQQSTTIASLAAKPVPSPVVNVQVPDQGQVQQQLSQQPQQQQAQAYTQAVQQPDYQQQQPYQQSVYQPQQPQPEAPVQQFASRHFGDTNTMAAMQTRPYPAMPVQ